MNCLYEPQISNALDGALPPADAAAFEEHLAGCASCRAIVADFRAIASTATVLERHAAPPQVWQRIQHSLADNRPTRQSLPVAARQFTVWRSLAAAAALLLMVGAVAWLSLRLLSVAPGDRTAMRPATATPDPALVQSVETQLKLAEEHYSNAIAGLDAIAKADDAALDPQTAEILQTNLAVIDTAIGESRAALLAEPSNALAQDSLFSALQSKVTLLQDTIALINEMRKGNGEGAARIVSGMNP